MIASSVNVTVTVTDAAPVNVPVTVPEVSCNSREGARLRGNSGHGDGNGNVYGK